MMMTQRLYFDDPTRLEFEAQVTLPVRLADGRAAVVLERCYFYPTGGGQEHDLGTLHAADGPTAVIDVLKDEDAPGAQALDGAAIPLGSTLVVLERPLPAGPVQAAIDGARRLAHMQHHTAQHLLTQCFFRLTGLETISANINGASPSTLDLSGGEPSEADLRRVEDLANAEISANRQVKSYFVNRDSAAKLPLRKAPTVSENIRIIEIEGYDWSACGGTHVACTGSIGLVKIVRLERVKERARIHFVAGGQALTVLRQAFETQTTLANHFSIHAGEVSAAVLRQSEQLRAAQKEIAVLRQKLIPLEAQELLAAAPQHAGRRLVTAAFDERSPAELRSLAQALRATPGTLAVLASYDGVKASLVVASAGEQDAAQMLRSLLAPLGGRGGGDAGLAQGGGPATPAQWQAIFAPLSE